MASIFAAKKKAKKEIQLNLTDEKKKEMDELISKYARGDINNMTTKVNKQHKHLKRTMNELKEKITTAATSTANTEILNATSDGYLEAEGNERTFKLKQTELKQHVDLNTEKNILDLYLTKFGPYRCDYSRNGRFLVFGGQKGHVAVLDSLKLQVGLELQLQETVHDVHYLHNESLFATAQRKYTYIYDHKGVEIHCLKNLENTYRLGFLPYHYLLTTIGHSGWLKWTDVSIGENVSGYSTGHGPCYVMKSNPHNAVTHLGHTNGVVSLWSPAAGKALVSMFCHKSAITDIAIDREGRYMATAGHDCLMKVWDLRKFTCIHAYKTDHPVQSLDFSDKGLLAMGIDRTVQILKDCHISPVLLHKEVTAGGKSKDHGTVSSTYMRYEVSPPKDPSYMTSGGGVNTNQKNLASSICIKSVKFRPLEDVLCIGHSHGLSTIIVPGSGEANFDSFEANPFINQKQRREQEVQGLLYKLSYDMIGLDSNFLGKVDVNQSELKKEHQAIFDEANRKKDEAIMLKNGSKKRARGRNKISAKLKRRQKNVIDSQSVKLKDTLEKQKAVREEEMMYRRKGILPSEIANEKAKNKQFDPLQRLMKKNVTKA